MQTSEAVPDALILEPELPIIDSHHHLWHPHRPYLIQDFAADLATGHNVLATVYVECSVMYRRHGPDALRSVGEVEFAAGQAAMSESGNYGPTHVAAAIIGAADLRLGRAVGDVLDALAAAGGGRFRGIRGAANWDADPSVNTGSRPMAPEGLLLDSRFRIGFAELSTRGLVFDAYQYHTQLADLCSLADAFPDTTMVVNHCGGLLRIGPYARSDTFARWRMLVADVARRPNVVMKLGGLAGGRCGFAFPGRATPPSADDLAREWGPYIESCIDLFGVNRCMFESNVPPDHVAGSYMTIWNAFKLLTYRYAPSEKHALFFKTASLTYNIQV